MKSTRTRFSYEMREEAFELYCRDVPGYQIARELVARYGPDNAPSRETVRRWANIGNWWKRREQMRREAERQADKTRAEQIARLVGRLEEIMEKTLDSAAELKYRSAEGAVRSLVTIKQILEDLCRIEGDTVSQEQLNQIIDIILEVLSEDEVLGPLLAEREDAIMGIVQKRLAETEGESGEQIAARQKQLPGRRG